MSSEEYHGKPWNSLSASRLKTLMDSERTYELKSIRRLFSDEDKACLKFGQFLHHVVLEAAIVDETNWSHHTVAMFETRNPPQSEPTFAKKDSADMVTDEIWVVASPVPGLFRRSRNWGHISGCHWRHEHDLVEVDEEDLAELDDPDPLLCGFVEFQDMLVDGDGVNWWTGTWHLTNACNSAWHLFLSRRVARSGDRPQRRWRTALGKCLLLWANRRRGRCRR